MCPTLFAFCSAAEARSRYINLVVANTNPFPTEVTLIPGSCFKGSIPIRFAGEIKYMKGEATFTLEPNRTLDIMLYRSQSDDCDGKQGYFTLAYDDFDPGPYHDGRTVFKRIFSFSNAGKISPYDRMNMQSCRSIHSKLSSDDSNMAADCWRTETLGDWGWTIPHQGEPPAVHVFYRDELVSQYRYNLWWTGGGHVESWRYP